MKLTERFTGRHPATLHVLQFFDWEHLPAELQSISMRCAMTAEEMTRDLPDGQELTAGLRKLLEAKDCFVRALVAAQNSDQLERESVERQARLVEELKEKISSGEIKPDRKITFY
jgi:hypothetical protein